MPATLEENATRCLVAANLTMPQLAENMGLSVIELTALCRHGDPPILRAGAARLVPAASFLGPIT